VPFRRSSERLRIPLSAIIAEALSVTGTGHKLFKLMCVNDLEGIVAKRLTDSYRPSVRWLKIKNPSYSQNEGRRELFEKSPRRSARKLRLPGSRRLDALIAEAVRPARCTGNG